MLIPIALGLDISKTILMKISNNENILAGLAVDALHSHDTFIETHHRLIFCECAKITTVCVVECSHLLWKSFISFIYLSPTCHLVIRGIETLLPTIFKIQ